MSIDFKWPLRFPGVGLRKNDRRELDIFDPQRFRHFSGKFLVSPWRPWLGEVLSSNSPNPLTGQIPMTEDSIKFWSIPVFNKARNGFGHAFEAAFVGTGSKFETSNRPQEKSRSCLGSSTCSLLQTCSHVEKTVFALRFRVPNSSLLGPWVQLTSDDFSQFLVSSQVQPQRAPSRGYQ